MTRIRLAVLLTIWSAVLIGCGGNPSPSTGAGSDNGNGDTIKIGSKPFTEQILMATMAKLVLDKHGFKAVYDFKGKDPALHQAILAGDIDAYWQYTGTELQSFLGVDNPPGDLDEAFRITKEKDAKNKLIWIAKAPFNDTNGLAVRAADSDKYGPTLTKLGAYIKANPNLKVCIDSEFRTRADGLPGLKKSYPGFDAGQKYTDLPTSQSYDALVRKDCEVAEVYTTDPRILSKGLKVVVDDKKFFPPDNVGFVVREEYYKKHVGSLDKWLGPMAAKWTTDVITDLNKQVDVDNKRPEDVARDWLKQNGFI